MYYKTLKDIKLPRHPSFPLLDVLLRGMSANSPLNVHTKSTTSSKQSGILQRKSFNFAVSDLLSLKLISYRTQFLAGSTALVVDIPLHKTEHSVGSDKEIYIHIQ